MKINQNFAVLDIGNSLVKIKISQDVFYFNYTDDYIEKIKNLLDEYNIKFIAFSSVNELQKAKIISLFDGIKINYQTPDRILSKQTIIDFSDITGMGYDRKFGLIGATVYKTPPLITVDCGTAITINVIDENYKSLGGAIFPGINMQAKALNSFTSMLPYVEINYMNSVVGKNTADAILIGILASVFGGIKTVIERTIIQNNFSNVNILFTGGNGKLVKDIFCENETKEKNGNIKSIDYYPNLVTVGIEKASEISRNCC